MRVGGNVWGEMNYAQRYTRNNAPLGTRTSLAVVLDARTSTEYGLLRTLVQPQVSHRTGSEYSPSANREGLNFNSGATDLGSAGTANQTQFNTVAMIQFGGFTVAHGPSMFQAATPMSNIGMDGWDQRDIANFIAYTASLGNGITATVALEDGIMTNRQGIFNSNNTWATTTGAAVATANANTLVGGVDRAPDYIAAFKIDQAWGSAQLSGAIHTINVTNPTTSATYNGGTAVDTKYGYALQANTKINLPMIGAGDYLWLNAVYTQAAGAFSQRDMGAGGVNSNSVATMGIGRVSVGINDLAYNWATGQVYKPTVIGGAAEFLHQFTPTFAGFVGGSYSKMTWPTGAQTMALTGALNGSTTAAPFLNPATTAIATVGTVWTPVKGLRVLADVEYQKISVKTATNLGAIAEGPAKKSEDAIVGRIQIRRDF